MWGWGKMKKQSILVFMVALVTLGSGVVSLLSVINPSLPERLEILGNIFPLEFIHLTRSFTLLIGFALIVSAFNIFKRKKRAFQFALVLAAASVVFHMTKGLDYEEASVSLFLFVLLILSRKIFTVKSTMPNLRWGTAHFATAVVAVLFYGIAGFWLLDKRHFDVNFHLTDAVRETFVFLAYIGDPDLKPHTHYARWFLDSLYLISSVGILYSLYALFRPVRYKFMILPGERERAKLILEQYGRHALDYFKLWHDKSYFFSETQKAFLSYRVGSNFAVVLGDPVGPESEMEGIICRFMSICRENDWGIAFHQTLPDFLHLYEKLGLNKLKIGDDAIVDLTGFTLSGKTGKSLRHTINKLEEEGIVTAYFEPPIQSAVLSQAKAISDSWLDIQGRRERTFTLGAFEPDYIRASPLFAAMDRDGLMQGFVNLIPSYKKGEATIDLMRRKSEAPHGVMDFVFIKLFQHLKDKGFERFNLGMSPMAGFQEGEEPTPEERAIHFFFQRMNFLFSFKGLHSYKAKFATSWEPRYVVYENLFDLPKHAIAINAVSELHSSKQ
jgi:phosphatidylglycerol lysyltransferase